MKFQFFLSSQKSLLSSLISIYNFGLAGELVPGYDPVGGSALDGRSARAHCAGAQRSPALVARLPLRPPRAEHQRVSRRVCVQLQERRPRLLPARRHRAPDGAGAIHAGGCQQRVGADGRLDGGPLGPPESLLGLEDRPATERQQGERDRFLGKQEGPEGGRARQGQDAEDVGGRHPGSGLHASQAHHCGRPAGRALSGRQRCAFDAVACGKKRELRDCITQVRFSKRQNRVFSFTSNIFASIVLSYFFFPLLFASVPGLFSIGPTCAAVLPLSGQVAVYDRTNERVLLFDAGGRFLRVALDNVRDVADITADARGRLWVTFTSRAELHVFS